MATVWIVAKLRRKKEELDNADKALRDLVLAEVARVTQIRSASR